ncbi:MAG: hypothetical protein ACLFP1_08285 [Candidatus Goldiibacteriota bacterium]
MEDKRKSDRRTDEKPVSEDKRKGPRRLTCECGGKIDITADEKNLFVCVRCGKKY